MCAMRTGLLFGCPAPPWRGKRKKKRNGAPDLIAHIYGGVDFVHLQKPFTEEKRAEVLLLRHFLENVNGPNTIKFQTNKDKYSWFVCFCDC